MSDNILYILPKVPEFVPADAGVSHAISLARDLVGGCDEASSFRSDSIRAFHPVECWGGVQCPACFADLDDGRFSALVGRAFEESGFQCLTFVNSCCGAAVSLNEMHYPTGSPVGFARFAIELLNPEEFTIHPDKLRVLEARLGCPLKLILARI